MQLHCLGDTWGIQPPVELVTSSGRTARERILGPEHPDTLTSRHNLANAPAARTEWGQRWQLWRWGRR